MSKGPASKPGEEEASGAVWTPHHSDFAESTGIRSLRWEKGAAMGRSHCPPFFSMVVLSPPRTNRPILLLPGCLMGTCVNRHRAIPLRVHPAWRTSRCGVVTSQCPPSCPTCPLTNIRTHASPPLHARAHTHAHTCTGEPQNEFVRWPEKWHCGKHRTFFCTAPLLLRT